MSQQDLIDRLTEYVENETRDLGDRDYVEVMENLSCNFDASATAKREEMDDEEDV